MAYDRQAVLEKLREGLAFIESGGYRNPARARWRPQFIFEDSPTCLHRDPTKPRSSCSECALMSFVPEDSRKRRIPCRYIPLNKRGETIESFYRMGAQEELEAAVVKWLKTTIEQLERGSVGARLVEETPHVHVKAKFVSTG